MRCKSRRRLQLTWMVKQYGAASSSSLFAGATCIMFLTELLNQSLKVAINSSDLPLDEMGTLLQVTSYVAHGPLPPVPTSLYERRMGNSVFGASFLFNDVANKSRCLEGGCSSSV
jgi:hypothetical protein